jgi:REP element-mobilizing transposase RayT
MGRQLELKLKTWGGKRKGAGRKPKGEKAGVSHARRPVVTRHTPAHVTLRLANGLPSLRTPAYAQAVRAALAAGREAFGFRLVHFSIQSNHLHLIVEATNNTALARGMKGLSVRVARAVNRRRRRTGKVFADRHHLHVLRTPREARHGLVYVLNNGRKHSAIDRRVRFDPCSSASFFAGWRGIAGASLDASAPVRAPRSWLLQTGWKRHGLIDPFEMPRCPKRTEETR